MQKRVLFVDDEPMVLDGLRRALHGMRQEWDMRFVSSAAAALEALGGDTFDAIVTDMRMPGTDGAQLLEQVKDMHPEVVRIVLSGQSDKGALLRSIAPAHQFLAKPCDLKELRDRLTQAFTTRDLLCNPKLATIVSRLRSVPSLPVLFYELTSALKNESTSLAQIEQIVSKDVGMAAKILQLANSAFIGAHGQVSSIRQALCLIGAEIIRSLTLTIHVFSHFDGNPFITAHLPALWNHSLSVASLAQRIAIAETGRKSMGEESFTSGLLHDVGKIVLLAEMPDEYHQVVENISAGKASFHDLEMEYVGCTHEEIGAYLMAIWGLPPSTIQAVNFHNCPASIPHNRFSPLTAVHCADAIASANDLSFLNHDIDIDLNYLKELSLAEKLSLWKEFQDQNPPSFEAPGGF